MSLKRQGRNISNFVCFHKIRRASIDVEKRAIQTPKFNENILQNYQTKKVRLYDKTRLIGDLYVNISNSAGVSYHLLLICM